MDVKKPRWQKGIIMLAAGTELAVMTVAGALGGYYLDKKWNSQPWCVLIGTLLGTAIGFYNFYRLLKKVE